MTSLSPIANTIQDLTRIHAQFSPFMIPMKKRHTHKYLYTYIRPPQFHGAHKSEICWMCDDYFVFMDSSAHQSLQQEGSLSLRGSLTELDLDLPVFILGFYLSLWETPV